MTKIQVSLRVRPLSSREIEGGFPICVAVENNSAFVTDIRVPERPKADSRPRYRQFRFDHGFFLDEPASIGAPQSEIYNKVCPPLEKSAMEGYNACLLAYGQSGTGKTHTMLGSKKDPGIIPRLCHSLWEQLKATKPGSSCAPSTKKLLRMEVSFMEIYREKVRDLLNPSETHLKLREHPQFGPHVQNLRRVDVTEENSLLNLLWEGELRRAIGTTGSNRRSSRSHAIWTIYITRQCSVNHSLITNQVHLVDLAGSEKAGFATAKNLLAEGADINRSLVALGNVISSLAERAQYIPYRDSALTWLLRDSLGGNATTSIIITASPASNCHTQTLNSFRFAERARLVENRPSINFVASLDDKSTNSSSLYSIMSALEIKKDISRLSKIIKTSQSNGGILRGMTPRASWTRLVNALEGWSNIETEQLKLQQRDRIAITNGEGDREPSVKSDAMNQTNLPSPPIPIPQIAPKPPKPSPVPTVPSSPSHSRISATEVFIPCSDSIKCLTWQQEKVQPAPKLPPAAPDPENLPAVFPLTPPPTPPTPSSSRLSKKLLPVQFPVSHHLDHASRISEKIHRGSTRELPPSENLILQEEAERYHESTGDKSPLKRDRVATLVNSNHLNIPPEPTIFSSSENILPVKCMEFETEGGLATVNKGRSKKVAVYEKLDPLLIPQQEIQGVSLQVSESKHRLVKSSIARTHLQPQSKVGLSSSEFVKKINLYINPFEDLTLQETPQDVMNGQSESDSRSGKFSLHRESEGRTQLEDVSSCYLNSSASESTLESDISEVPQQTPPRRTRPTFVKIIPEEHEADFYTEVPQQTQIRTTRPTLVKIIPEVFEEEDFYTDDSIPNLIHYDDICPITPIEIEQYENEEEEESSVVEFLGESVPPPEEESAGPSSKFRTHFSTEIQQMEKIGQQLKKLQGLSKQCQRFNVVQPFLQEITELDKVNHFLPDDSVDSHIESCSGWNIDVEYAKVSEEIESLGKLLQTGNTGHNIPRTPFPLMSRRPSNSSQSSATVHPHSSPSPSPDGYDYNFPQFRPQSQTFGGGGGGGGAVGMGRQSHLQYQYPHLQNSMSAQNFQSPQHSRRFHSNYPSYQHDHQFQSHSYHPTTQSPAPNSYANRFPLQRTYTAPPAPVEYPNYRGIDHSYHHRQYQDVGSPSVVERTPTWSTRALSRSTSSNAWSPACSPYVTEERQIQGHLGFSPCRSRSAAVTHTPSRFINEGAGDRGRGSYTTAPMALCSCSERDAYDPNDNDTLSTGSSTSTSEEATQIDRRFIGHAPQPFMNIVERTNGDFTPCGSRYSSQGQHHPYNDDSRISTSRATSRTSSSTSLFA